MILILPIESHPSWPMSSLPDPVQPNKPASATITPWKCLRGSVLAAILALLLYRLTTAIAQSFAAHPISTHNQITYNLSVAVRTLVVGLSTMATAIFAIAALGLVGLAIQLVVQKFKPSVPPS